MLVMNMIKGTTKDFPLYISYYVDGTNLETIPSNHHHQVDARESIGLNMIKPQ